MNTVKYNSDKMIDIIMQIRAETISKVKNLKCFFETSNMTDAVVRAVQLTHMIALELARGSRIELHRRNGEVKELLLRYPYKNKV